MIRRKRLACLGLATAVAVGWQFTKFGSLLAGTAAVPPGGDLQAKPTSADLLKQGVRQYDRGDYEQSVSTLQQIDPATLDDQDRSTLIDTLTKAGAAASQRRAARAEFARGEDARKDNRLSEARGHYQAVLDNDRADDATRRDAQREMAVIDSAQKEAKSQGKTVYNKAVDEYKKGLWNQSRADFTQAQQLGYNGSFLEASPAEYLKKIDQGEQQYNQKHAQSGDDLQKDARQAYERARQEYRSQDYVHARQDFAEAQKLGFQPAFLEGLTPAEYISRIDEKQQQDAQANTVAASGAASGQTVNFAATTETSAPDIGALQQTAELDRIRQQQKQYQAQTLVTQGQQAENAGNFDEALTDYSRAVDADPTNQQAAQGRDRMQQRLGRAPTLGANTLSQQAQAIQTEIQRINYTFRTSIDAARADIANNDFAKARNDIANARNARDQDPTIFSDADLRRMDAEIAQAQSQLDAAARAYDEQRRANEEANAASLENQRLQRENARRQAEVEQLIKLSRTQIDQQNYTAALGVLDQILQLDPTNDYARGVRQFVEDKSILQDQRKYRETFDYNMSRTLNRAEEMQVPYDDIFRYPDNWPDISEMRDQETQNSGLSKEDKAVQAQLDRRLPSVAFTQPVPFTDAIDFLRDITGANILVNWKALEAAGIDKQTPITATLHDVKFSKVLDIVLQQGGAGKLAYTIDDGVIEISTTDELNKAVITRVYDIRDLLIDPNFDPTIQANFGQSQVTGGSGGGGGGGSGTSSIFQGAQGGQNGQTAQNLQQQLQDIKKKIENTVEFSSWKDNDPNGYGQIDDFNDNLIITQTAEVHNKIANLLAQLREMRAVQVTVETRFLTVNRNFLEDVGVNLGVTLNRNNSMSSRFTPISITNGTSNFTTAPNTGVPGSLASNEPAGLGVTGSYLDDVAVNLLVNAVQAARHSSIVHAPRVTMHSGQGATIMQETFLPYVANVQSTTGSTTSSITATIGVADDGVILQIFRAVVSADHKYVTLDLYPILDSFLGFRTFTFQSPVEGGTTGSTATGTTGTTGTGTGIIVSEPYIQPPELTIQEPTEEVTAVKTRVTVPDGGTLLLGGLTIAGEVNLEAGVPVLSSIPFLNRLTTNQSSAADEEVLIILVKPTIIIDKEIEAKTFPLLSSNTHTD